MQNFIHFNNNSIYFDEIDKLTFVELESEFEIYSLTELVNNLEIMFFENRIEELFYYVEIGSTIYYCLLQTLPTKYTSYKSSKYSLFAKMIFS